MNKLVLVLLILAFVFFLLAFFSVGQRRALRFEWLACAMIVLIFLVGRL